MYDSAHCWFCVQIDELRARKLGCKATGTGTILEENQADFSFDQKLSYGTVVKTHSECKLVRPNCHEYAFYHLEGIFRIFGLNIFCILGCMNCKYTFTRLTAQRRGRPWLIFGCNVTGLSSFSYGKHTSVLHFAVPDYTQHVRILSFIHMYININTVNIFFISYTIKQRA